MCDFTCFEGFSYLSHGLASRARSIHHPVVSLQTELPLIAMPVSPAQQAKRALVTLLLLHSAPAESVKACAKLSSTEKQTQKINCGGTKVMTVFETYISGSSLGKGIQ